jgi:hypothetical protein
MLWQPRRVWRKPTYDCLEMTNSIRRILEKSKFLKHSENWKLAAYLDFLTLRGYACNEDLAQPCLDAVNLGVERSLEVPAW